MKHIPFDASLGFDTPIGPVTVRSLADKVTQVLIGEKQDLGSPSKLLIKCQKHIIKLLDGKPSHEEIPYSLNGTPFQLAIWRSISEIPFGQSTTYSELAIAAGSPKAVRAAGAAVGANPVPLLIGCHRILGSGRKITGYSGGEGLPTKRKLLAIEKISYRE